MQFDEPLRIGQAETRPAMAARVGRFDLLEGAKHPFDVLRRDADSGIRHADLDALLRGRGYVEPDAAAFRRELDRVSAQVGYDLQQKTFVGHRADFALAAEEDQLDP